MSARLPLLVLLFLVASVVSAVILAGATWALPRAGVAPGPWSLPVAVLVGFLPLFFAARTNVLPRHLATPAWRAVATLTLWLAIAFAMWQGAMAVTRPMLRAAGFERGTFVILLACLLAGLWVIEVALRRTHLSR